MKKEALNNIRHLLIILVSGITVQLLVLLHSVVTGKEFYAPLWIILIEDTISFIAEVYIFVLIIYLLVKKFSFRFWILPLVCTLSTVFLYSIGFGSLQWLYPFSKTVWIIARLIVIIYSIFLLTRAR